MYGTDLCMVNLNLADVQYQGLVGRAGPRSGRSQRDALEDSMCQYVVNSEMPFVVKDFLATEEFRSNTGA